MDNPLLEVFNTPYQSIPFSTIQPEHFIPALKENIKNALETIDKVAHQTDPPTFENTIEALQDCGGTTGAKQCHFIQPQQCRNFLMSFKMLPNKHLPC